MIIQNILTAIYNMVTSLITFTIPQINTSMIEGIGDFLDLMQAGLDIYRYFVPAYGSIIITIIVVVKIAVDLYFFVMWILKKIPMLDIH